MFNFNVTFSQSKWQQLGTDLMRRTTKLNIVRIFPWWRILFISSRPITKLGEEILCSNIHALNDLRYISTRFRRAFGLRRPGRSLLADEWTLASVFVIISRVERSSLAVVTSAAALAAVHPEICNKFPTNYWQAGRSLALHPLHMKHGTCSRSHRSTICWRPSSHRSFMCKKIENTIHLLECWAPLNESVNVGLAISDKKWTRKPRNNFNKSWTIWKKMSLRVTQ